VSSIDASLDPAARSDEPEPTTASPRRLSRAKDRLAYGLCGWSRAEFVIVTRAEVELWNRVWPAFERFVSDEDLGEWMMRTRREASSITATAGG
jgi:hypothetical protein